MSSLLSLDCALLSERRGACVLEPACGARPAMDSNCWLASDTGEPIPREARSAAADNACPVELSTLRMSVMWVSLPSLSVTVFESTASVLRGAKCRYVQRTHRFAADCCEGPASPAVAASTTRPLVQCSTLYGT